MPLSAVSSLALHGLAIGSLIMLAWLGWRVEDIGTDPPGTEGEAAQGPTGQGADNRWLP